jgi:hypothetical protein
MVGSSILFGRKETDQSVCYYPKKKRRVSRFQAFFEVILQTSQLTGEQCRVTESTGLHDGAFDDRDDVSSQFITIRPPRRAQRSGRCLQVGLELLRHLVKTLGQAFSET